MKKLITMLTVVWTMSNNCYVFTDAQERLNCQQQAVNNAVEDAKNEMAMQNLWNQANQTATALTAAEQLQIYQNANTNPNK